MSTAFFFSNSTPGGGGVQAGASRGLPRHRELRRRAQEELRPVREGDVHPHARQEMRPGYEGITCDSG